MITLIIGSIVFGYIALEWRNSSDKKINAFKSIAYAIFVWFCSFWLAVWIQLDLLNNGTLGDVIRHIMIYSPGPAIVSFFVLRRNKKENNKITRYFIVSNDEKNFEGPFTVDEIKQKVDKSILNPNNKIVASRGQSYNALKKEIGSLKVEDIL